MSEALQILGGSGYMTGTPHERMLRDARILLIFEVGACCQPHPCRPAGSLLVPALPCQGPISWSLLVSVPSPARCTLSCRREGRGAMRLTQGPVPTAPGSPPQVLARLLCPLSWDR